MAVPVEVPSTTRLGGVLVEPTVFCASRQAIGAVHRARQAHIGTLRRARSWSIASTGRLPFRCDGFQLGEAGSMAVATSRRATTVDQRASSCIVHRWVHYR